MSGVEAAPAAEELQIHDLETPLPTGSTLIEASAGTGKTYTIAAIFLRLIIEEGLRGEQILVTTFTIPATAELRERIRTALREAFLAFRDGEAKPGTLPALLLAHADPAARPEIARRLEEALHDFDQVRIATIHGFCQRTLADCAFESGAAPQPEFVLDETELVREVVRDFWRCHFYEADECIAAAARQSGLSLSSLESLLALRLQKPLAHIIPPPAPERLSELCRELSETLAKLRAVWRQPSTRSEVEKLFVTEADWAKSPYSNEAWMREQLALADTCLRAENPSLVHYSALLLLAPREVKARAGIRKNRALPPHPVCALCDDLHRLGQELRQCFEAELLETGLLELARRKVKANLTSFSDLLLRLHSELQGGRGAELATRLRQQYRAALIDEFQDTDQVQEQIFQSVFATGLDPAEKRWLFLIGDPKQAIYSFRGADVFSYLEAARLATRKLTLRTNYRSTAELVAGVNAVFQSNPAPFIVQGIGFEPARSSQPAAAALGQPAPLRLWVRPPQDQNGKGLVREEFAAAAAAEIARLLAPAPDGAPATVRPEEIAVLTVTNFEAALMQTELRRAGVPSVVLSMSSVFASREATELLALMAALAEPAREDLIRGVLLTDLLGLQLSVVHALAADEAAWEARLQQFQQWHEAWTRGGFMAAFRRALREGGIRARLAGFADGERRLSNLAQLSELAQCAAMERQLSPVATVQWLATQRREALGKQRAQDEAHELRLERDERAVRIITVHKSKGLQYDIVFCPFSWAGVYLYGEKKATRAVFHDEAGQLTIDLGSPQLAENLEREKSEDLAEEVRLFYVGLTRARHRCDVAVPLVTTQKESAVNWLLQQPPAEAAAHPKTLGVHVEGLQGAGWSQNLEALQKRAAGTLLLQDPPSPELVPPVVSSEKIAPGSARRFTAVLERDFCVSSFSSLTAGASAEVPEQFVPPGGEDPTAVLDEKSMHAFPGGTKAGVCLHDILERLDFTQPDTIEPLVSRKLTEYSLAPERWTSVLTDCLRRLLALPLEDGFTLGQIPAASRLAEREFHLPAGRLEPRSLQRILHGPKADPGGLDFSPRRGWLKGFIDLVFRHGDRFYLADWKSNRLGTGPASYSAEGVRHAMHSHHYVLQAHLYAVALHRYLRQRQRGYDYEKHFGGLYYFFVRGLDPAQPHLGVWRERPSLKIITALEAWLAGSTKSKS